MDAQRIWGAKSSDSALAELDIPASDRREWTVEADFIDMIKTRKPAESTFYQGVKYMEFTKAVFRSVERGATVHLPIGD